jgi:hypothetical protein
VPAGMARADVDRAFSWAGPSHGFSAEVTLPSGGTHSVCLFAINAAGSGGGNTPLSCRSVVLPASVQGSLEGVGVRAGTVTVRGWSLDSAAAGTVNRVHVYVGSRGSSLSADQPHAGVVARYPDVGSPHGFSASVTAASGRHQVCAYGMPVTGSGSTSLPLGCRTVTVP